MERFYGTLGTFVGLDPKFRELQTEFETRARQQGIGDFAFMD